MSTLTVVRLDQGPFDLTGLSLVGYGGQAGWSFMDRAWQFFTGIDPLMGLLWIGLTIFTLGLAVLMYTRWGQSHPLHKCMALSLLAHLLLAGYATTVQIVYTVPPPPERVFQVALVDGTDAPADAAADTATNVPSGVASKAKPWEQFPHDMVAQPDTADLQRDTPVKPSEPIRRSGVEVANLPDSPLVEDLTLTAVHYPEANPAGVEKPAGQAAVGKEAEPIHAPQPQRRDAGLLLTPSADSISPAAVPTAAPIVAKRTPQAGDPQALLGPVASTPRLVDTDNTPDPAKALQTLAEEESRLLRTAAAKTVTGDASGSETSATSSKAPLDAAPIASLPRKYEGSALATLPAAKATSGNGASGSGAAGGDSSKPGDRVGPPRLPSGRHDASEGPLSDAYRLRTAPNRSSIAEHLGATAESEAAVKAALKWLAESQNGDGRWIARQYDAGRELLVLGQNRKNAGIDADSGLTGLALLAFLASGHTHRDGVYRENVRRGLEYLLGIQASDGNLAGAASGFARMYCHGMATFALSEAYGMTGDQRLERPVRRAIGYTVAAQNTTSGGWRYMPGDPGDTSQLGWQLMALKSAELAGIPIPEKTRENILKYLLSVTSGAHGGLAAYRPTEPPTRTMTAEALVCWQFLGLPREHPAGNEAGDYLLTQLPPGTDKPNLYFWYYATLAMHQLEGTYWQQWNGALQAALLGSQQKSGPQAGSWDTDSVWGGYGGRVYTTALATLTLEVYYRFLPLYAEVAGKSGPVK
jgi:hypothetical protein